MSDHEELESLVAPWVLGALEPGESEIVRTHIDGCPTCRDLAGRLSRVVGEIPVAVDEVAPPARLRERVLSAASAPQVAAAPVAISRRPAATSRPARRPRVIPVYAAAAIALLALIAGLLAAEAVRAPSPPAQLQATRFTLTGHQQMSGAQATVIDDRADGLVLVDFRGLPQPGDGRVYELWLIRTGSNPLPVGTFVPDSTGAKIVLVDHSLSGYSVMAVTNEPGPAGSPAPSQQPQLYGNLA
ncbi:MAG TPA: anti-sigma factor [Candidatus Limnocylindrales bacterium]|nr:anti-sigma factor [Candidatus Limnocylindrales bacterium]